jgi:hypothetical protein
LTQISASRVARIIQLGGLDRRGDGCQLFTSNQWLGNTEPVELLGGNAVVALLEKFTFLSCSTI